MLNKCGVLISGLAIAAFATQAAHATPNITTRDTVNLVNTGSSSFSGATDHYQNTLDFDTSAGSYSAAIGINSLGTGITIAGFGGTTISPNSAPNGTPTINLSGTSPGGTGQGFTFAYDLVPGTAPGNGQSQISTGMSGGFYTLTFDGGGVGLVGAGGTFISTVELLGDWSNPASHSGLTNAASYTVTQDFVYDGTDTFVTVETTNYTGIDPAIDFTLFGAAVAAPEPASIALLSAGMAGLGFARRRRRG